ncbi:hypothetical protein V5O48_001855 [Marasmius crinis-equi]|uniref:MYND-type domain-containing protein n=1 Tax=Marasmius crinis-equi TaxID=585013 RepID=A0ABR3FXT3_9AGAR
MNIAFNLDYMDEYVLRSAKHFPSIDDCINGLKALGPPPSSVNLSDPGENVETAFEILAALTPYVAARNSTPQPIADNWNGVFDRWVIFVLWKVALTTERPTTPSGMNHFDRSITSIMILLQFTAEGCRSISRSTPILQHLVCQCWYLLVDMEHPAWAICSLALLNLVEADEDMASHDIHTTLPTVIHNDGNLGRIMIKHLNLQVHHIRTRHLEKLDGIHVFLMLQMPGFGPFKDAHPMFTPENVDATVEAAADLLRIIMRVKRRFLRNLSPNNREFRYARDIVMMASDVISRGMFGSLRIQRLLSRGKILSTLLGRDVRYYQSTGEHDGDLGRNISDILAGILDNISKFLVYPGVLRQFMRSTRGLTVDEDELRGRGMDRLWVSWRNTKERAASFGAVRSAYKENIGDCSYDGCVFRGIGKGNSGNTRYQRCVQCSVALYCSIECRKAHWKQCHRLECLRIAGIRRDGNLFVTRPDICFFEQVLGRYLHDHAAELGRRVRASSPTLSGYVFSNRYIEAGSRLAIVRVAFDTGAIPDGGCAQVLDKEGLKMLFESEASGYTGWVKQVERQWEHSSSNQLCVIAVFPKAIASNWPASVVLEFPPEITLD